MGGNTAPQETVPVVTPEQQAADAAKVEAEKRQTAAKEAQKNSARSSLQELKDSIKLTPPVGAETSEVAPKVPKFSIPFTRDGKQAFLDGIVGKAKESLSATDEAKKERLSKLYAGAVFDDFMAKFLPEYYFLLADGVDGNISLDVAVDDSGKVSITTKEQPKVDGARNIAEGKAKEGAEKVDQSGEVQRFQKEHPDAFDFLKGIVFGNDASKLKAAFEGGGFFGFLLGVLGYGGGKSVYGVFMKNKNLAQFRDSALDHVSAYSLSMDFRTPVDLEKQSDMDAYYKDLPSTEFRTVQKKFVVKDDVVLGATTTFAHIIFPKGANKVSFDKASKKDDELGPLSLKREEEQEKITIGAGMKLEAGTVFHNITIGDKKAIEAALNGAPAAAAPPVATAPMPAAPAAPTGEVK